MEKQVISFRASEAEVEALRLLQQPGESSLGQIVLRLVREAMGIQYTPVNAVNKLVNVGLVESAAPDRELIRDEVEERTAYLAIAMNEVKSQLEDEINLLKSRLDKLEVNLTLQVSPETTNLDEDISPNESAIATETTIQDVNLFQVTDQVIAEEVTLPQASRPLTKNEMKSKVNSIAHTLKIKGLEISRTIIKSKITEMYPNSEDWISDDARKEVIRALVK